LHQGELKACGRVDELLTSREHTVVEVNSTEESLVAALKNCAGDALISVNHPRERLESFFRRIVAGTETKPQDGAE
jgi:hypothetical protein